MIHQIQKLHAEKDSLTKRIAESKKIMDNGKTSIIDYCNENAKFVELEKDLESVIVQLENLTRL